MKVIEATRVGLWLVLLVFMASMVEHGVGQGCTRNFFSVLLQLMPCRPAVAPFSLIPPSEGCCSALRDLGQPCLCVLLNGPPLSGVDHTSTLQLPAKCAINYAPCNASFLSGLIIYAYLDSIGSD